MWATIQDAGDTALLITLGQSIDPIVNAKVLALRDQLSQTEAYELGQILDLVPGYCTLLVIYQPLLVPYGTLKAIVLEAMDRAPNEVLRQGRHIEISVDYDPLYGPDQARVAQHCGLSIEAVIEKHANRPYLVYMLGFLAGFPYLGGLDPALQTPRLESPRLNIESGSVGIGASQTGVYTVASPGGWNIIGKTQHALFNAKAEDPFLLEPGDTLIFKPSKEAYLRIEGEKSKSGKRRIISEPLFSEPIFSVISPGLQSTIQDYGRFGYLAYGISPAGVMDRVSYRYLMALLNQPIDNENLSETPGVVEWVLNGPILKALAPSIIAIGGNVQEASINEKAIEPWRVYALSPGDTLNLGSIKKGLRGYLAIRGSFDAQKDLGSLATDKQNALGPPPLAAGQHLKGRVLTESDHVLIGRQCAVPSHLQRIEAAINLSEAVEVAVIIGPQQNHFTEAGIKAFLSQTWQANQQMNRMAIRLEGNPIELKDSADIISDGINLGAIQVSGNQLPMVMLNDRQTVGGYAKIANVIEADLSLMAQLKPGMAMVFKTTAVQEAHERLKLAYAEPSITKSVAIKLREKKHFNIYVNGRCFEVSVEDRD